MNVRANSTLLANFIQIYADKNVDVQNTSSQFDTVMGFNDYRDSNLGRILMSQISTVGITGLTAQSRAAFDCLWRSVDNQFISPTLDQDTPKPAYIPTRDGAFVHDRLNPSLTIIINDESTFALIVTANIVANTNLFRILGYSDAISFNLVNCVCAALNAGVRADKTTPLQIVSPGAQINAGSIVWVTKIAGGFTHPQGNKEQLVTGWRIVSGHNNDEWHDVVTRVAAAIGNNRTDREDLALMYNAGSMCQLGAAISNNWQAIVTARDTYRM